MIDLPYASVSEVSPFRLEVAMSRFLWRYMATLNLLSLPDLGGGDLSDVQRRTALEEFVVLQRPLTALALFWSVVSFEDLMWDFGTGLSQVNGIDSFYPDVKRLAVTPKKKVAPSNLSRPDSDAFSYLDIQKLNENYYAALGIDPIDPNHEPRLTDLAIIRHTVAHHGAVIRPIDKPRFKYYNVMPGRILNPPAEFVRETAKYLYEVAREFMHRVRAEVFSRMVTPQRPIDSNNPPMHVVELIELFDYFDKLPSERGPVPFEALSQGQFVIDAMLKENYEIRQALLRTCLDELAMAP